MGELNICVCSFIFWAYLRSLRICCLNVCGKKRELLYVWCENVSICSCTKPTYYSIVRVTIFLLFFVNSQPRTLRKMPISCISVIRQFRYFFDLYADRYWLWMCQKVDSCSTYSKRKHHHHLHLYFLILFIYFYFSHVIFLFYYCSVRWFDMLSSFLFVCSLLQLPVSMASLCILLCVFTYILFYSDWDVFATFRNSIIMSSICIVIVNRANILIRYFETFQLLKVISFVKALLTSPSIKAERANANKRNTNEQKRRRRRSKKEITGTWKKTVRDLFVRSPTHCLLNTK